MDFTRAMDLLGLTGPEAAELLGVSAASVRQARLDPSSAGYRTPPPGWEKKFAALARERCPEIRKLAELDGEG